MKTKTIPSHQLLLLLPAGAAISYPFFLLGFNLSINNKDSSLLISTLMLTLAFSVPFVGFFVLYKLGKVLRPTQSEMSAKFFSLISIGSPPLFTALGVLLYMAGDPIKDTIFWCITWIFATLYYLKNSSNKKLPIPSNKIINPFKIRVAHGVSALIIIFLFLVMHISNHLAGILSEQLHRHLMDVFRIIYRAKIIEPIIVTAFLFQVVSGYVLLHSSLKNPGDLFRSLQIMTGAYVLFFILGHMNSVFFYARMFAGISTDWNFAVGAPSGLLKDAWNVRLIPHYFFGVFCVMSHITLGARIIAINHGMKKSYINKLTLAGVGLSAFISLVIILGMNEIHVLPT